MSHENALRDTLTRAAWYGLIDNGKLANQIARLEGIVVKYTVPTLHFAVTISHVFPKWTDQKIKNTFR